ncbi:MAG: DUF1902 domain-containing protein [Leptolyngbyaceae cyanobacterium RU_5_1]|nr:DUF1902 domain-containing protein [Leptolyngbyaceae cyanobacterium RU_5_1]
MGTPVSVNAQILSAVWVATSEDVSGLATEADTIEALSQKLRDIIPDLLLSNHVIAADYAGAIAIQLTSHRRELIFSQSLP